MSAVRATIIAAALAVSATLAAQGAGLTGIVGLWTAVDDGGPATQIDGAKWSGKTDPAEARAIAKRLFGSAQDKFVANATAPGAFPLAVFEKMLPNFTGGTISVQFKMVAGASDQTAGIVFDLQPNGEYLFLRYNTKDGNLALWAYREGERARVAEGKDHAQLPMKVWHSLSVTIAGNKVTAAIPAAKLTFEHTLDKPVSGRVGVWTKRDSVTTFRQFMVSVTR